MLLAPPSLLPDWSRPDCLVLLLLPPSSDRNDLLEMLDKRDFLVDLIAFLGVLELTDKASFSFGGGEVSILT